MSKLATKGTIKINGVIIGTVRDVQISHELMRADVVDVKLDNFVPTQVNFSVKLTRVTKGGQKLFRKLLKGKK